MRPPALEIKLILVRPGAGWEFVVRRLGEVIAASDGDANLENVGVALKAAWSEIQELVRQRKEANRDENS